MNDRKDNVTKKDLQSLKKEIILQFHLISEGLIDQIKLLAEGHSGIIQKLEHIEKENEVLAEGQLGIMQRIDRVEKENERQHVETRSLVKISFSEVDKRLFDLESHSFLPP
jgi:hypothetical protein